MFRDLFGKEVKIGQKVACMPWGRTGIMTKGVVIGFTSKNIRVKYKGYSTDSISWCHPHNLAIVEEPTNET